MMKKMRLCVAVLLVLFMLGVPEKAEAATASQVEACTQELLEMLYTADLSRHDISQYRITKTEFLDILEEVRYGEGAEIEGAYFPSMSINYTSRNDYMRTVWLLDVNEDAVERYNQMQPIIDSILAGVEADMTDLDKLIYLHGEVVDWVTYQQTTEAMYTASGAFIDKKAVCAGYAKALNILLHRVGIDATYVKGTSLNHGWSYVELDGQWYHVDPTWDDTRASAKGQISRNDLLRNDAEFSKDHGIWTVKRIDEASNSTLYKDWFVHDIVGEMSFEDGVWYYLDTKNKLVMAADAKSRKQEAVFDYSALGSVTLVDAVDDQLILKVNGKEISKTVEQWKESLQQEEVGADKNENDTTVEIKGGTGFFSDFSLWRTGQYNASTGTYALNQNRICLNELIENTQSCYEVLISNENYRIAVRELNERKKMITSVDLGNGDSYVPTEGTVYLAITVYNGVKEKGITFNTYEGLFLNGFVVGLIREDAPEDTMGETDEDMEVEIEEELKDSMVDSMAKPGDFSEEIEGEITDTTEKTEEEIEGTEGIEDTEKIEDLKNAFELDFCDILNWRTGQYNSKTGTYASNKNRICLNELIENTQDQYLISIANEDYRIAIRELNEKKKIITSVELGNGDVYVPTDGTVYLAISIYNGVKEKGILFSTYENLFAEGFEIGFYVEK